MSCAERFGTYAFNSNLHEVPALNKLQDAANTTLPYALIAEANISSCAYVFIVPKLLGASLKFFRVFNALLIVQGPWMAKVG